METLDMQIRAVAEFGKFYSEKGFETPSDEVDVEMLIKDGKYHLFVIQYPDDNNIKMLFKQAGTSFQDVANLAFYHFTDLAKKTPISTIPTLEEIETWNANRKEIIKARVESGDIKPVKINGSVIHDDARDIIGDLI